MILPRMGVNSFKGIVRPTENIITANVNEDKTMNPDMYEEP